MIVYDRETIGHIFLSPYVSAVIDEKGLHFQQSVFRTVLTLNVGREWEESLLYLLEKGCTRDELTALVKKAYAENDAETLIRMLAGRGIIE